MLRQNLVTLADQQRKVNDILQLAGIARPVVSLKDLLRGLADQRYRQAQALAVDAEEVFGLMANSRQSPGGDSDVN